MVIDNTTLFIDTQNQIYPLDLAYIRTVLTQFTLPTNPPENLLKQLGFSVVHPTEKPKGEIVEEVFPVMKADGTFYQEWRVRKANAKEIAERLEEQRKVTLRKLDRQYDVTLRNGYLAEHEGKTVRVLLTDKHRPLLTETLVEAQMRVAEGNSTPLRVGVKEQLFISLVPVHALRLTRAAIEYCRFVDGVYQDLLLAIRHTEDEASLPVIKEDLLGNPVEGPKNETVLVDPVGGIDKDGNVVDHETLQGD